MSEPNSSFTERVRYSNPDGCAQTAPGLDVVSSVAVSPDRKSLYAAGKFDNALVRFKRDPTSGALTKKGCIAGRERLGPAFQPRQVTDQQLVSGGEGGRDPVGRPGAESDHRSRAKHAERRGQAEGPMANPVEMGHTLEGVVKFAQSDRAYRELFLKAWGTEQITIDLVTKSIASFERTVVIGNSPFDRFYYGGDKKALSLAAQRGLKLFLNPKKGNCSVCHVIGKKYALFTDNKFHNIGVGADTQGNLADAGRYTQTKNASDLGAFKTPTLRNIAETRPYMHDGSQATLKDVVDHYVGGGTSNPHLDKEIHALDFLTFDERADLKAFLESLRALYSAIIVPPPLPSPFGSPPWITQSSTR